MFEVELVGDQALMLWLEGMPANVQRILAAKMGSEITGLAAVVKANASKYAPSTEENYGNRMTGKLAGDALLERAADAAEQAGAEFLRAASSGTR